MKVIQWVSDSNLHIDQIKIDKLADYLFSKKTCNISVLSSRM